MKMIKKTAILLAVMLTLAMCFAFGASAEILAEFDHEGISYEIYSIGMEVGIAVTDVDEQLSGVVTIPQNFDDVEVKRIDSKAFLNCTGITEIIIPSTVYKIGDKAFSGCTALETVTLGSGVKDIGEKLFSGCTSLEKINIAEGNTAYSIGADGAVYNLKKTALVYCPAYAVGESYSIAEGVTSVKSGAFCDCTELKSLDVASTVDNIEGGAFNGSAIYDDQTNWENGALYIGGYLIETNTSEASFEIREGTTKIAQKAFTSSEATTVIFPESMVKIADNSAFYDSKVRSCYVPTTVGEIDRLALRSLTVYYEGTEEQWKSLSGENGILTSAVYFNHPEAAHSFTNYQSDNNATIFLDGTKTAYCDYGCGVSDTLKDEGSMLAFGKPESVTSVTTTSSITLNWTEVKGATGYRIFYMTANGWKKCATLTDTTRTFSNLKAGAKFTFAVRAYNIDGDVLTWAPTYSTYETSTRAVAPAKITVAQNTNAIRLNWTACPGATGYRIYYKLPSDASWKVSVSTTNKTTHTYTKLKSGSKYTFAVRPYIKTADAVIWSAYTTYTAATKPATPVTKVSSPSVGTVTVSWNAVNGADGYRVYYKLNNGAYKLYGTYTSATTLTFNNLKGGVKYTFAVRAGVRTSGGVVWSGYQEKSVTLAYRIQRYLNAIKNGTYYIEMHDGQGYYDGVALKNGSACVRMNYAGEVFRIVYDKKTNKVYDIYDTGKEYIELVDDGTFAEMTSGLSGIDVNTKIIKSTTEKVGSKTYFVEVEIEDGVECKYYFDGAALVMEKLTYEGESIVYYYSQFTNKVPDSLFTIPSDYKKITV